MSSAGRAEYRLPGGKQVQKKIGSAWAERGRPRAGYFTKRTAEAWLQDVLVQARQGTLPGMRSGQRHVRWAAEEWLRLIQQDRERKPSTIRDYRSVLNAHLLPVFGERLLESITVDEIEQWRRSVSGLSNRPKNKLLIQLHGIFRRAQRVYGLDANPLARVEKHPLRASGAMEVLPPEEVWSLVHASATEVDGTIFLTAAFTGRWMGSCWRCTGARSTSPDP